MIRDTTGIFLPVPVTVSTYPYKRLRLNRTSPNVIHVQLAVRAQGLTLSQTTAFSHTME